MDIAKKLKIGNKVYNFKITNKTIFDIEQKYGNYSEVIQGILEGKQFYTNAMKLLSCSCIDVDKQGNLKEWDKDEIAENLTPKQLGYEIPTFILDLYFNYIGIKEKILNDENNTEKN